MQITIAGYEITEKLYESTNSLVYRALRLADQQSVILKLLNSEYPSPETIAWFKREYEILRSLNLPGVVKADCLINDQNRWVMVLEDFGGESLARLMQSRAIAIDLFFAIAIELAEILAQVHQRQILHKDINPANLVFNPTTGQLKLIDFGIATVLAQENISLGNPQQLEGTLAYISPEQTGRMNRRVDYRTDLYSLGVTFYELLTGQLPFSGADALELVHAHIARNPVPLYEVGVQGSGDRGQGTGQNSKFKIQNSKLSKPRTSPTSDTLIPKVLSDIVMKLMAKNAEDRYQSAYGLKADLEECYRQWQATGAFSEAAPERIAPFRLGQQDSSNRFQIPQKLYGRECEIEELLAAFERVAGIENEECGIENEEWRMRNAENSQFSILNSQFKSELMLVSGYSGIGKSALVREVYKPMTQKRGYFISGKFDQFQRDIPYDSLVQAFQSLMRQLLTESDDRIQAWHEQLLAALEENGQVIIEVIPELELIIGPQSAMSEAAPVEAQNRFNRVFQQFIHVFTQADHPLVLFLDDLQWADRASLQLLERLLTVNSQYLFVIGAYRDNEVDLTHPLITTLDAIRSQGGRVNSIQLGPLELSEVNQLVADALNCDRPSAFPLAELVVAKTNGNPFFVNEFLKSLDREGLLTFSSQQRRWQWDVERIRAHQITDNVVELITSQVQTLQPDTKQLLQQAACIGNQFDLQTLAIVCEQPIRETAVALWPAIAEGLIIPLSDTYKLVELEVEGLGQTVTANYQFAHDRIQQAVYSLTPIAQQQQLHLQIGQLLLQNTPADQREQSIFDIVNHLNQGQSHIQAAAERVELAQLNLVVGKKAKASAAYQAALAYLRTGLSLLKQASWQTEYDLTLELHVEAATAAYLNADFESTDRLVEVVLQHANSLLDQVKVYEVQIQAYTAQAKLADAVGTACQVLSLLGIQFPAQPGQADIAQKLQETQTLLANRSVDSLVQLPAMTDPQALAAIRIMASVGSAAYFAFPSLFPLMVLEMVRLSIQHGNALESVYGYVWYGLILCGIVNDIEQGYQFGELVLHLLEPISHTYTQAKALLIVYCYVLHWKRPIQSTLATIQYTFQLGMSNGAVEYAGYSAGVHTYTCYLTGQNLTELEKIVGAYCEAIAQVKQDSALSYCQIYRQAILNLLDQVDNPCHLIGKAYDESSRLPIQLQVNDRPAIFYVYFNKLILCYLFSDFSAALENANQATHYLDGVAALIPASFFHFYDSLICLALLLNEQLEAETPEYTQLLTRADDNQSKLRHWATHAPENYLHKVHLVDAELARLQQRFGDARESYDRAIDLAQTHGYLNEAAIASELAARFYMARNQPRQAALYLQDAYYAYQQWGAIAKTKDLETRYPDYFGRSPGKPGSTFNLTTYGQQQTASEALDLSSVLKASQALSGEIVLDNLLRTLMQLVIENAGAQKGFLILNQNGNWVIEAEGVVDQDEVTILRSLPIDTLDAEQLPLLSTAIVNYVTRTQESLVLNDATTDDSFASDPYIAATQPQSILCTPLLHQGKLSGILYLENNLITNAFTSDRLEVLRIIASQTAISLENALLYRTLEQKVAERTAQLAQANQEITLLNQQLQSENLRMSAELDITRRLQQMILPKEEELNQIPDLDIAGFMEPADEVGGDYYDVLHQNGLVKIGIGDVTGHGLESGVLMLMVQTAVRTLLANQETDSAQFLGTLNRVIYDNVQRMNSERNLTLALLDYQAGQLRLSGQHEEILLIRAGGAIERVNTGDLGFPIGLIDDITEFVADKEMQLQPGDGVVLYTDGITEAMNTAEQLYGLERLCQVVSQSWDQSAQGIRQSVIEDVRRHIGQQKVYDDITLLVLKQK